MEGELVSDSSSLSEGESEKDITLVSFTEQFREHLPFYISIGMTPEQYWDGDYDLPIYYRKAYELLRERRNEELWLQGLYFYEALGNISPLLHAFAKDGTRAQPYSAYPYPVTKKQLREYKAREKESQIQAVKTFVEGWAKAVNKNMEQGGETDG